MAWAAALSAGIAGVRLGTAIVAATALSTASTAPPHGLVHDQVTAQHRESGVGALEAEVAGAVGVHHGVLGHQRLLAAEAERLGQRAGLAVRQGDQAGPVLGGLGLDRGGGSGLGGGAHLDDAGEEGGGGEYGAGCERSLHVQVLPGNRVRGRASLRGAGVGTLGAERALTCCSVRSTVVTGEWGGGHRTGLAESMTIQQVK